MTPSTEEMLSMRLIQNDQFVLCVSASCLIAAYFKSSNLKL